MQFISSLMSRLWNAAMQLIYIVLIYIFIIQAIRLWRIYRVKRMYRSDPFFVMRHFYYKEFPFSNDNGSLISTLLTFAVPTIAERLQTTAKFIKTPAARHEDTAKLMRQCLVNNDDTDGWQKTFARLKSIHRSVLVDNKYYLYTLAVFAVEPIRFVERFDYRMPLKEEKYAIYECWKKIGQAMGISEIPETYPKMEIFKQQFEAEYFKQTSAAGLLTATSIDYLGQILPQRIMSGYLTTIFDDRTRKALGIRESPIMSKVVRLALFVRRIFVTLFGFPRIRYTAIELNK